MNRVVRSASIILAASCVVVSGVRAQGVENDSLLYGLDSPPSQFEWGCFDPCLCPIMVRLPLAGTFILRRSDVGPFETTYDVLDVHWKVNDGSRTVSIRGAGVYVRGGEVAEMEQLTLDLSFDGGPSQRFDSGRQPAGEPLPVIDTRISLHGEYCRDSVLAVHARPLVEGVGDHPPAPVLVAAPHPFSTSTEIRFTLPGAGHVDLAVFDVTGRRVRVLCAHEWLAGGIQARAWDGKLESGTEADAGLYWVRLETPSLSATRRVAKLR